MPIRIENVVFLFNEDSICEITGNENIIKNNKYYDYSEIKWNLSKNPIPRIFHYLGRIFRGLMDICFGISSGYKLCCIRAFITNRKYQIDELQQILCYKCYKKLLAKRR